MNPGDLVVRIWLRKPLWDMIGIIVDKTFEVIPTGGAEWRYAILWNTKRLIPASEGNDKFGSWTEKEFKVIDEYR